MTDDRLLRITEVAQMTSLGVSSIRRMTAAGKFPQPVSVSDRAIRWWESSVQGWMQQLKERGA